MKEKSFFRNMSWIMIGNLLHAALSFAINIIVTRHLSVNDNGILNYATSWITFYNAIAMMGVNNVINKFTTESEAESKSYLLTAIFFRLITGIIAATCVIVTIQIINPGERIVLCIAAIQSCTIIFSIGDTLVYWFRYKREANVVAIVRLIAFVIPAIIKIVSIVVLNNLYVYTVGLVLENLLFSILLFSRFIGHKSKLPKISIKRMKEILFVSYPFIFSAVLATIYAQTDRIMLKNMMDNDSVGYYSAAVTIAGLMSIVVSAIIEGFRPEIIACKGKNNTSSYEKRLCQAYAAIFWICIAYGVFINVFGKYIIIILYGEKYLPSVKALSLVVWYTSFAYFGTINNIYLVAEGSQKLVQLTTFIGAFTNIVLNLILIPRWGIEGAAVASLITQFVANLATPACIRQFRPVLRYMIKGVTLRIK